MFVQIALGSVLLVFSIIVAGSTFWIMEYWLMRQRAWLIRAPHRPKLILVMCLAALAILMQMTIGVWTWAIVMMALGLFETLELSVYFALVAFTTLGFGDVLLPQEWRLLAGMAAVNGLLNIGFVTALLVDALRQVRLQQIDTMDIET